MKSILTTLAIGILLAAPASATIRTVSNLPAGGAQYSTLQAAYNAAANGDTLLVEGTNLNYTMTNEWSKSLVVIGAGFNTQKQNFKRTLFNNVSPFGNFALFYLTNGSSGSRFYGIEFNGTASGLSVIITFPNLTNILFENCKFINTFNFSTYNATNFTFRNCIFDLNNNINVNSPATNILNNILFTSCIFDGYIEGANNTNLNYTFDQCLFLSTSTTIFSNLQYATVKNSIFMNIFPCCGATNSVFLNNLCRIAGTFPPTGTGNTGSGNLTGVDPQFTSFTNGQMYATTQNYTLLPGSPAIGTALGGGDIGLHGGGSGFSRFGEVLYTPVIRSMNIQNTSVSSNGTLNIDLNISKPANN